MPSVPPRAVRVRPLIGGGAAGDWGAVYRKGPPGTPFSATPGEFVYVHRGDGFEFEDGLAWALSAGSPDSAAAVYQTTPDTQVTVTWVPSSPAIADSYRIRRADGSLAGTVAAGATSFVDTTPRPLNGTYRVHGVLGGVEGPATNTNALNLTLQPATAGTVVNSGGTAASTVTINWTHNALGRADQYQVFRDGVLISTVAGTVLTTNDPSPPRGSQATYSVRSVLSSLAGASRNAAVTSIPAAPPATATLVATNPPLSNLRLSWTAPANGSVTGYEVQRSTNGSAWTAHGDVTTPSDWATAVTGWMRVRATSAGGPSEWVQRGPVAPINDVTPPANATVTSYRPESSYGRMVIRFTCPPDADFNSYLVQRSTDGTNWTNVTSWVAASPSQAIAVVVGTFAAGANVRARVWVRDDDDNQRTGPTQTYGVLEVTPITINPSGSVSGTWRVDEWRNDATRSTLELATGGTGSGQNCGCWFYGTTIATELAGKTVISADIQYWRENEGGSSAGVQPQFWTHGLATRVGNPIGTLTNAALGTAVARPGVGQPTSAIWALTAAQITALQNGTKRGIAMYRTDGTGDPDTRYMLLPAGNVSGGSPTVVVNGRLRFNHLG